MRTETTKETENFTDSMAEYVAAGGAVEDGDPCDYCGRIFNPMAEGHTHSDDDECDCPSCLDPTWKASVRGKSYCSPECEMHDS